MAGALELLLMAVAKKASAIINHRQEGVEGLILCTGLTPSPVPPRLKNAGGGPRIMKGRPLWSKVGLLVPTFASRSTP
jgi:hypothetical protein